MNETKNHTKITQNINEDKLTRWHQRYRHLNITDLKNLKVKEIVKGVEFTIRTDKFQCEICDQNKIHIQPFKLSKNRANGVLDLVH